MSMVMTGVRHFKH